MFSSYSLWNEAMNTYMKELKKRSLKMKPEKIKKTVRVKISAKSGKYN